MNELFNFTEVFDNLDKILSGFWATIRLASVTAVLALIIGTVLVSFRVSPTPVLRGVGTVVVNVLRNTPLTLVALLCVSGLSDVLKVTFSDTPSVNGYWWAVTALSVYTGAFVCEALRSGVNTVPLGQAEAARSIGLTFGQSLRMIILPQAFRAVVGPLGSVLIAMIKNTTIVAAVAYGVDAVSEMKIMFFDLGASLPIFIGFAIGYLILTLPAGFFFGWLAKRMAVAR
ncbi:amino acid ABC transporter permease [Actinomadura kijaniata]|uniref:Glutamate transport system permease protein n=1 Tax=Actinomadura namibiensis TaxID=182080 RepID=A0A7W3QJS5_ACTNM|nr:amino acid ABC transporter permease [Actinomadura namibiensis]MBA8949661.1 glutamate transport system permease protein [Actinomadura namibiensis]